MKKPFCDICGEPAFERLPYIQAEIEAGPLWRGYRMERGGSGCDGSWQPFVRVQPQFTINKHQMLPEGAQPDLCRACARKLLVALVLELGEPGPAPETKPA